MSLSIFLVLAISALIMLWFIVHDIYKRSWWVFPKLAIASVSIWIYVLAWSALPSFMGWASYQSIPKAFRLHWGMVYEAKKTDSEIYIWLTPLKHEQSFLSGVFDYQRSNKYEPRAYRVNYNPKNKKDRAFHKMLLEALAKIKKGEVILGRFNGKSIMKGNGKNGKGDKGSHTRNGGIEFYPLPYPKCLSKDDAV